MDASGFVYNSPTGTKPDPEPESSPESVSETGPESSPESGITPGQDELEAASIKARALVEGANRYLMKMHGQMSLQAKEAFDSAREEGFLKGYKEGQAQAFSENEKVLAQIVSLLEEIDRGKDELFKQYEQDMVDLALDIARKVVDVKLQESDEAFLSIFRKAAEGLHGQKTVRLQISGHEARFATASSDYLLGLINGAEHLDIEVAEDKEPGTCILETDDVLIDASAVKQVEKLVQAVEDVR
jgi:flagellar assembly protein FliH